jgi:hypothetical protein
MTSWRKRHENGWRPGERWVVLMAASPWDRSWVRNAYQVLANVSARPHAAPKSLVADDAALASH